MVDYFSSYSRRKVYRGGNGFDYFSTYSDYSNSDYKNRHNESFINSNGELEHSYPYDVSDDY